MSITARVMMSSTQAARDNKNSRELKWHMHKIDRSPLARYADHRMPGTEAATRYKGAVAANDCQDSIIIMILFASHPLRAEAANPVRAPADTKLSLQLVGSCILSAATAPCRRR